MSPQSPLKPPYAEQPWFTFFWLYHLATLLPRFCVWAIWFLPRFMRPRPSWSLRKTLTWRTTKHFVNVVMNVGPLRRTLGHLILDESAGVKGVWIRPCPELVIGDVKEWADVAGVACIRVPAYWLERKSAKTLGVAPPDPKEKVVFALHGGAYAVQSAHPTDPTSNIPRSIMKYAFTVRRSLTLEYRLTKDADAEIPNPFPAALIDAIAGYSYLVRDVGFDPSQIVIEGDSAGGNLALALVRYLVENRETLGLSPPSALVLCSPWADMSHSDLRTNGSPYTNRDIDWIDTTAPASDFLIRNFVGPFGMKGAKTNRFISPAAQTPEMDEVSYKGFPRTFLTVGGCEVNLDQARVLKKRLERDIGKELFYVEPPDGIHDILVFSWFEPDRTELLRVIARWIDQ